jgi:hypothetical protein
MAQNDVALACLQPSQRNVEPAQLNVQALQEACRLYIKLVGSTSSLQPLQEALQPLQEACKLCIKLAGSA